MLAVLDELRVSPEGDIHVAVILPDVDAEPPDILITIAAHTPIWEQIRSIYLARISAQLGREADVTGITHAGQDRFTIVTSAGDYVDVEQSSHPAVLENIARIAGLVAAAEATGRNPVAGHAAQQRQTTMPHINRLLWRPRDRTWRLPSTDTCLGILDALNPRVLSRTVTRRTYAQPNEIEGRV
jgi:hypothetical protein